MPYKNIEDRREYLRRYRNKHREKIREQTRIQSREWSKANPEAQINWKKNNPEKSKEIGRRHTLKVVGWTVEEFDAAFIEQNGCCWLCSAQLVKEKGFKNTAHADHNHKTNKKRALLCMKCNLIEGHIAKLQISYESFFEKLKEYYNTFDTEEDEDGICSLA